jgi:hypothetical protein
MNELEEYSTIVDFSRRYPNIARNEDSIRWKIHHRHENGLAASGAVVKRQGRWYIHAGRYAFWMLNGGEGSSNDA